MAKDIALQSFGADLALPSRSGHNYESILAYGNAKVHLGDVVQSLPPTLPPTPFSTVPLAHDPDFVDDSGILEKVLRRLEAPGARVALVGLGGVGKTQVAVQHAYYLRQRAPETWVLWLDASNSSAFHEGVRHFLNNFEPMRRSGPGSDCLRLLEQWLLNERNGSWLVILDNANYAEMLEGSASDAQREQNKGYVRSIPLSLHGRVIVTARTKRAAVQVVGERDVIELAPMAVSSAADLLAKKLVGSQDRDQLETLAKVVDCMPLALVQSAAYISRRAPRVSVSRYLAQLHKDRASKMHLLGQGAGDPRHNETLNDSILSAWQISFEHVRCTRPSAADRLALMSFFDGRSIPDIMLKDNRSHCEPATARVSSQARSYIDSSSFTNETDLLFEGDIMILRDYSIVTTTNEPSTFTMHALLQLAMHRWLISSNQFEHWEALYIDRLVTAFPKGRLENWATARLLYPHAKKASESRPSIPEIAMHWAELMHNLSCHAAEIHEWKDMRDFAKLAVDTREDLLGPVNSDTLQSIRLLASAMTKMADMGEAEELYRHCIDTSLEKLTPATLFTPQCMEELADLYENGGRWSEAEELTRQVLDLYATRLGSEHSSTLRCTARLAHIYQEQRQYERAESLYNGVIEIAEASLKGSHPDTLVFMHNLSMIYKEQGRLIEAEALQTRVLEARRCKMSDTHLHTLISYRSLAHTYQRLGKLAEAAKLLQRAFAASQQAFGEQHLQTKAIAKDLSRILEASAGVQASGGGTVHRSEDAGARTNLLRERFTTLWKAWSR